MKATGNLRNMAVVEGEFTDGTPNHRLPFLRPHRDFAACSVWMGAVILAVGEEWDESKPVHGKEDHRVRLPAAAARELAKYLIACADELDKYALDQQPGEDG